MNGILPSPQYEYDREWRWPWWKFELMPDLLFTTLHERFNTRTCPIQSPQAFLFDVRACAEDSPDVDTFYAKLAERRDQRVVELEAAWSEVCCRMHSIITRGPICGLPECKSPEMEDRTPLTKNDKRYTRSAALSHLSRTMAFDCLIDFFDGFVRDNRKKGQEERTGNQEFSTKTGTCIRQRKHCCPPDPPSRRGRRLRRGDYPTAAPAYPPSSLPPPVI